MFFFFSFFEAAKLYFKQMHGECMNLRKRILKTCLGRDNMSTYIHPILKILIYIYIIRVFLRPLAQTFWAFPPRSARSDQNVLYVLGWALDEVQRPATESVSKWITLTKFLYRTCGVKRCWVRAVYIQGRSFSHQRREVWTGQDCLIEFVQAVSWDGNGSELWLLQQCYNNQRRCLDGCHLPDVAFFFFFTLWARFGNFCSQILAVCKYIELLSFFILLLHITFPSNTDTGKLTKPMISESKIGNRKNQISITCFSDLLGVTGNWFCSHPYLFFHLLRKAFNVILQYFVFSLYEIVIFIWISTTDFCIDWLNPPPRYVQSFSKPHIAIVFGKKYNYEVYLYIINI
jgi:hypothetical protein